jgi:guanyl-specific ribonuclease Sa
VLEDGRRVRLDDRPPPVVLSRLREAVSRLHPAAPLTRAGVEGFQPTAGNAAVQTLVAVQRNKAVAAKVAKKVKEQDGAPLEGYEGGRVFGNHEGRLPSKDKNGNAIKYWEYDVYPLSDEHGRGKVRVVIDSSWNAWYTNNHYKSFTALSY